jgi:DNA-binding MarR family transcriptional regulator
MVLRATPGLSTAELARSCAVTPPAMGRATDGLMRRGLIERRPHPTNRRILQLYATTEGIETAKRAMALLHPVENEIARNLGDTDRDLVRSLVKQMITSAAPYPHW